MVNTEHINGKEFIKFENEYYEVIGIIDYGHPTRLDQTAILSFNESLTDSEVFRYVMDSNNLASNFDFVGRVEYFGQVTIFDRNDLNLLNIVDSGDKSNLTINMLLILLIINTVISLNLFVDKMSYEIKVKKIVGYSNRIIINNFIKAMATLAGSSVGVGFFLSVLFAKFIWGSFHVNILVNTMIFGLVMLYAYMLINKKVISIKVLKLGGE